MKVFFGVVTCILISSAPKQVLTANIASETTSDPTDFSVATESENTIQVTTPIGCTNLVPPQNESISIGKTNVNTTWNTNQTDAECIPLQLRIVCVALEDDNIYGWEWVVNNSVANVSLNNNVTSVNVNINNLSEFTNYTCNATLLSADVESASTPIKFQTEEEVSSPPRNLIVSETTDTAAFLVTWEKPIKNPGIFKRYHVLIFKNGANYYVPESCGKPNYRTFANITTAENYLFSNPLPNYNYTITVFAENNAGNSSSSYAHTLTKVAGSDEPRNLSFTSLELDIEGNGIVGNLSWTMPCQSNGAINKFQIVLNGSYILNDTITDTRSMSKDATNKEEYSMEVRIKPAFYYYISIRADGENTTGSYSILEYISEDNFPGPPIIKDVSEINSTYFVINWDEPRRKAGNITNYQLEIISLGPLYHNDPDRCSPQNDTILPLDGRIKTFSFNEGRPYYNYTISVTAFTSKGAGNSSNKKIVTTLSSVPERPENFNVALEADDITGVFSWITPCNINGPIQKFMLSFTGSYTDDSSVAPDEFSTEVEYKNSTITYIYEKELLEAYSYKAYVWIILENSTVDGKMATASLTTPDGFPGAPSVEILDVNSTYFNIQWKPPSKKNGRIQSYQVNVSSLGPLYTTQCTEDIDTEIYTFSYNDSIKSHEFESGRPYYNYSVSVQAITSRGSGDVGEIIVLTNSSVPENVNNITTELFFPTGELYDAYVKIEFDEPCRMNGPFKDYILNITEMKNNEQNNYLIKDIYPPPINYTLKPEYNYNFSITTHNEDFKNTSNFNNFLAPSGVPIFDIDYMNLDIEITSSSASVTLRKEYFRETNGEINYVALILLDQNITGGEFHQWDGQNWPYDYFEDVFHQQVTKDKWQPFRDTDSVTVIIGNETECDETKNYCNKVLENDKAYYLIVRLFTNDFYRNSPTILFKTDDISRLGTILGILFGLLAFSLLGFAGFYSWRKHIKKLPPLFPRKSSAKANTSATSIPIHKFTQYCKNLENCTEKVTEQYTLLVEKTKEAVRMHTTMYSELTENRRKNRYTNILPFDETRVKLLIDEDDEIGSDYINASYIKGYSGKVEYIATQGPLPSTCRDFWKMVVQEQVSIIVMVAQFIEQNKEKCYKYFPKNHENMIIGDDIEVRCSMELHFGTYCVRTLQVKKDVTQISVTHMQYLDWPDFNVPSDTETMLQFCYQIRERLRIEGGCVIVHCSAGVGRTGTLIATDILLQNVKAGKNIDVFSTVLDLRKQRTNMVQTQKQYMYIHRLIKDSLNQSSQRSDLHDNTEHIYENQSVIKMKEDGKNLIAKELETESQF